MGDIADAMLNGDLCVGCGSFMDLTHAEGVPRYCSPQCRKDFEGPSTRPSRADRKRRRLRELERTKAGSR